MSWYRTGTVSVSNGSASVTGATTAWSSQAKAEDRITFDGGGKWYEIQAVNSNTSITLASNFAETTVSGGAYAIDRSGRGWSLVSELAASVSALLASATHILTGSGAPSNALGIDGDIYLRSDSPALHGPKAAGAWPSGIALANHAIGENLIINGDFQVNQKQFAGGSLANGVVGYDRWKGGTGTSISLSGYVVTLTGPITQKIVPALWGVSSLASTAVTISADTPGADLTVQVGSTTGTITAGSGRRSVTLTTAAGDTGNISVTIAKASAGSVTFGRVKLELGSSATPWSPRPADHELRLCQRFHHRRGNQYAQFIGQGFVFNATTTIQEIQFPVEMFAVPTLTATNKTDLLCATSGVNGVVSDVVMSGSVNNTPQRCMLAYTHSNIAAVAGQGCIVQAGFGGAGSYGILDFSAEP